jgi:hypothetical protein
MEFTDRYKALGIPYPNLDTMCKGPCEGVGYYPENDPTNRLWILAEREKPSDDGWHFITCPDCNGTGKHK